MQLANDSRQPARIFGSHRWCSGIVGIVACVVLSCPDTSAADERQPMKVFILAGQSNMQGHAKVQLMNYQAGQSETKKLYAHLRNNGQWATRNDVWIKSWDRKGRLTVGYGASRNEIGPELQFGWTVGDHYDDPVLIIKTATGGASLYRDFRPPSAGLPPRKHLEDALKKARKKKPKTTLKDIKSRYGRNYRRMMADVRATLTNLATLSPEFRNRKHELAGFVWFQGWNDMINPTYTAAYTENLAHFIRDVRRDLGRPELPFVIGQMGVGGEDIDPESKKAKFKQAQAAVGTMPEFRGNVAVVKTDVYWDKKAHAVFKKGWKEHIDEWKTVGSNWPFHYLGSARTMLGIGKAFGKAIIKLHAGR